MIEESFNSVRDGAKKLISEAKNICIIPSQTHEPESLSSALALFYTLKDLGKNVNLITGQFPENLGFLIPSPEFISQPQNLVISIPRRLADVSQVYYEKTEEQLKIHLTLDRGQIKKEDVVFYFENAKPDVVITLGTQDFQAELAGKLDSFGFLLSAPVVNIDNHPENKKFGAINIIESTSLSEIALNLVPLLPESKTIKEATNCLLAGMVAHYENFKTTATTPTTLKTAAKLMEQGANYQQITQHLYTTSQAQMDFLAEIFKNLKNENGHYVSQLHSENFWNFGETEGIAAMEKIRGLGLQNNLLVLWQSHASQATIKGFFYSKTPELVRRMAENTQGKLKNGWTFLSIPGEDISATKKIILNNLQ